MTRPSEVRCNLCGGTEFTNAGSRKRVKCVGCGSVERTRLLWMHLEQIEIASNTPVLHLAPERGLYESLSDRIPDPDRYVCADIEPQRYPHIPNIRRLDLCDLDSQPSDHYGLIVHSHVLEHVPCNVAYSLYHLHRMLKPDGHHVCVIPFSRGHWDECFGPIGQRERTRRFGQYDHVRRFGVDDLPRHLGSLVSLPDEYDLRKRFGEDRLRQTSIPESAWTGFTIHTVLELRKYDMKLLRG